jgi:LPS export ABC transporter protein LptC
MASWQKRARLIVALVGVTVLLLVAFTLRRRPPPEPPAKATAFDPKAESASASGRIILASGTKTEGYVRYETMLTYGDGTAKLLRPKVTITRNDRNIEIVAKEGDLGKDRSHVTMRGDVRLKSADGLSANTEEASYSEGEGIVRAPGRVRFKKGAMTGSAVGMSYDEERDVLKLLKQVVAKVAPTDGKGAADIVAGSAEYARSEKHIRFEHDVRMVRDGRVIRADSALARLTDDEEKIQALELREKARVETSGASGAKQAMTARDMNLTLGADGESLDRAVLMGKGTIEEGGARARARRIAADMIDLTFHPSGEMSAITARKHVELTLPAQGDAPEREVASATMDGTGAPEGGLDAAKFAGGVEFRERPRGKPPRVGRSRTLDVVLNPQSGEIEDATFGGGTEFRDGSLRTASADARYRIGSGVLELRGPHGRGDPRVEDDRLTVEAKQIDVTLEGPKLVATGSVRSVVRPSRDRQSNGKPHTVPGMLKDDQPVYVTAATLNYDGERSLATYTRDARLWQGDTTIQGDAIAIDEASGDLKANGSVRTAFILDDRDEKTKEVKKVPSTATSKDLHYEDKHRRATYTTDAHMNGPQGDLRADRIELYFVEGGGELDHLEADRQVRVVAEKRSASGDHLTYFAADGRYVLRGEPVRTIDEECRETVSKTLTFWRSTDRILADANEESRTQTKSGGPCAEPRPK